MIKFDCKIRKFFQANQAFYDFEFQPIPAPETRSFPNVLGVSLQLASSFLLAALGQAVLYNLLFRYAS
jgi:hypothetical protein